uniref:Uncharacterized protein n=1 Tax=Panagrolaimus superbus TaxID=310955 RepID=A0A914Z8I7_9BILA
MEGVLYELMENVVNLTLKGTSEEMLAQIEEHIKYLSSACKYITASQSGQMLRKTCQTLIDALQKLKRNNSIEAFENAKTATALNLKAYEKIGEQAAEYLTAAASQHGTNSHPHNMSSEERQTLMRTRLDNLKISRENLAVERKLQESLRRERTEAHEKLCQIMINMERLNIEEVDLKDVVHYLRQGIQQLSRVQVAWGNIVTFFSRIKNTVDGPLMENIEYMTKNVKNISDKNITNVSEFQRLIILREITNASVVANVLMESASLYMNVSKQYVQPTLDKSIINMSLTQDEAKSKQCEIVTNFYEIKSAVENTIEDYSRQIQRKVYGALQDQDFYVGRFIE